jgi:hypothetical protein
LGPARAAAAQQGDQAFAIIAATLAQ